MYLVDTNILSEARRGTPAAVRWLRNTSPDLVRISVITLGEIMRGAMAKRRKDEVAGDRLLRWLTILRTEFADRIEPIDHDVALEWGRLGAIRPVGEADGLLAATAVVRKLTLVTRNTADFAGLPVLVLDPWQAVE